MTGWVDLGKAAEKWVEIKYKLSSNLTTVNLFIELKGIIKG
jgi:hypothetical protein